MMAKKKVSISWQFMWLFIIVVIVVVWRRVCDLITGSDEFSLKYFMKSRRILKDNVRIKKLEPNCGLPHACPLNSFSMFLSTGVSSPENKPKLCVNGKHLSSEEERGLNAAVVEPNRFDVISYRNFDTHLFNKTEEIAEWVESVSSQHIIILFTYDEASFKLGIETKSLLNELGSGKIQNLQFRSQWYMITQKKSKGFTVYEKITYSKKKKLGDKIEFRGCIPKIIPKKITTADEPLKQNVKRAHFCHGKKENKYQGFCNEPRFEIMMPALLTNKSLMGNRVYSMPIYVYSRNNLELTIASLDSLLHQPGIQKSKITVLYEKNSQDVANLSKIYGINSHQTEIPENLNEKFLECQKMSRKNFPAAKYLIVIDENVISTPDFLYFMAQVFPILEKDKEVSTISGWSPNCYEEDGNVHVVHRIQGLPKYAALISVTDEKPFFRREMFAPDVARVQGPESCHLPSLEPDNWIERPQDLSKNRYYHKMVMLQQLSQEIEIDKILIPCSQSTIINETNAIYVDSKSDKLPRILECLGVKGNQYGEYNGIIRLFVRNKTVLIITNSSSFYKSRPITST